MDEDKPRKRDTQLTGLASAKRILARRTVRLGGARPFRPTARPAIFLAAACPQAIDNSVIHGNKGNITLDKVLA
jgi:hypothetical protein